jgi:hypothetical protein
VVSTLYDVLGITPQFSSDAIRRLRGVLAREYSETGRAPDEARMAAINAAIDVLGDPARRLEYDESHGIVVPEVDAVGTVELERRLAALPLDRNLAALTIVLGAALGVVAWWLGFLVGGAMALFWGSRAYRRSLLQHGLDVAAQRAD